jgi:hypothetical protein
MTIYFIAMDILKNVWLVKQYMFQVQGISKFEDTRLTVVDIYKMKTTIIVL